MRWPFRRGTQGLGAGSAAPAPPSAAPVTARPAEAGRPAEPAWTSLPPLRASWRPEPPLTTTLQPAATPLTSTPLTVTPNRAGPARPRGDGAPEPGRVVGLAAVVVPPAARPEPAPDLPAYFRNQPPLRHVTPRPITEHAALTEATAEYVGEPVVAAPVAPPPPPPQSPFGPSAPLRADPPVQAAATEAGARFREALANLHNSGHPRYEPGGGTWGD